MSGMTKEFENLDKVILKVTLEQFLKNSGFNQR